MDYFVLLCTKGHDRVRWLVSIARGWLVYWGGGCLEEMGREDQHQHACHRLDSWWICLIMVLTRHLGGMWKLLGRGLASSGLGMVSLESCIGVSCLSQRRLFFTWACCWWGCPSARNACLVCFFSTEISSSGNINCYASEKRLFVCSFSQVDVIHCDLKPENILLQHAKRSNIKVIDFGSSCRSNNKVFIVCKVWFRHFFAGDSLESPLVLSSILG